MKVGRTPESIAAGLTVPERILLLCIDSRTDWQKVSRITGETVTAVVAKGLVDRDASGRLTLTGEGRAAVAVLLKADYAPIWARQGRTVRGWERRAPRRCLPPCVRPTVSSVARGPGPPMCPRPQGPGPPLCQGRYPSVRVERERRTGRRCLAPFDYRERSSSRAAAARCSSSAAVI
jgi:hypothetical protein